MDSRDFPPSPKTKQSIVNAFFDCSNDPHPEPPYESFHCYYRTSVKSSKPYSISKSYRDIISLVELLRRPEVTRNSVESGLRNRLPENELEDSDEILKDSINLGTRLLLMISTGDFRSVGHSISVSRETKLYWTHGT
jgi:hypothetical protein